MRFNHCTVHFRASFSNYKFKYFEISADLMFMLKCVQSKIPVMFNHAGSKVRRDIYVVVKSDLGANNKRCYYLPKWDV